MARGRKWSDEDFIVAVSTSTSIRQTISKLGLIPAGGNYQQTWKYIHRLKCDTRHFTGQGWSKGKQVPRTPVYTLEEILVENSYFSLHALKKRLFKARLKEARCEECGWSKMSEDGRIPIELDHINGDRNDNRLENLRILCPNCHSLKPTHRGRNILYRRGGGTGQTRGT